MPSDALRKMSVANAPASSKIRQARSLVDSGVSSADARRSVRTGFTVDVPSTIPSDALNGKYSISDVRAMRDNREQSDLAKAQWNTDYNNLTSRIGNTQLSSPFTDPEGYLNRLLLRGTTDTQMQLDTERAGQAEKMRGFATDYTEAGKTARENLGIPELQKNLAETRTQIAERRVKLRETLRDFETNAERRGVAREFVDAEKAKVQADATTELADLAIIESAQLGNLTEARTEVDNILTEKKQAFEFENDAIQAEIDRLSAIDTREATKRAEELAIALAERKNNIDKQLANEKEQREYMVQAAANGADQGTLTAIRNAKSPQEALFLAGPWIGKLDRARTQSQLYTDSLQQQKLLQELDPTGTSGDLAAYGNQYAETGKLPSVSELKQSNVTVSQVTDFAKQSPKPGGALLSANTGVKPTTLSAAQEAGIIAMNEIVNQTIPALQDRFGKIATGLLGGLGGMVFTSQDRQDYLTFRQEFLSKLLVARSGAAVTEQEYERYANMLPTTFNQMLFLGSDGTKKLNSLQTSMTTNLNNILNSTQTVIQGYSKVNVPSLGERTVGEVVEIGDGKYRVLPDGSLTDII